MIDFKELFDGVDNTQTLYQKKVNIDAPIGIYWGFSKDGYMRISFLSKHNAPIIDSTQFLRVTQGSETENVFWTCFDLLKTDAKLVFYAFCENMVESVLNSLNEHDALVNLRKRYITWKALFKNKIEHKLSKEVLQGLFGELLFLKNYMIPTYSAD